MENTIQDLEKQISQISKEKFELKPRLKRVGEELSSLTKAISTLKQYSLNPGKNLKELKNTLQENYTGLDNKYHSLSARLDTLEKEKIKLIMEYEHSIIQDRDENNSTFKYSLSSLKWINQKLLNPKSCAEYTHFVKEKRRCELELAFSIMPHCSKMGANQLSNENALKFIEHKRRA